MTEKDVVKIFQQTGAWLTDGHFEYTSKRDGSRRHGTDYLNKYALYPHTKLVSRLCRSIAIEFIHSDIQVVVAPAMGGIVLSQWIAFHLSEFAGREILGVYAEKSDSADFFMLNHGFGLMVEGKRTLVVEDILTSGGSALKVIKLVRSLGGYVVGVGSLWNRGKVLSEDLGSVPKLFSLVNIKLDSWPKSVCSLCKKIPLNKKP